MAEKQIAKYDFESMPDYLKSIPLSHILKSRWVATILATLLGILLGRVTGNELNAFGGQQINAFESMLLFVFLPMLALLGSQIYGLLKNQKGWSYFIIPAIGMGYGIGALLSVSYLYLTKNVVVNITTTVPELINKETIGILIHLASMPFELVNISFDQGKMLENVFFASANNQDLSSSIEWRNFLLASITFYSVLPRFVILVKRNLVLLVSSAWNSDASQSGFKSSKHFDISTDIKTNDDFFLVSEEESRLLFSLQKLVTLEDIENEKNLDKKIKKRK